jgi:hypothetical protein
MDSQGGPEWPRRRPRQDLWIASARTGRARVSLVAVRVSVTEATRTDPPAKVAVKVDMVNRDGPPGRAGRVAAKATEVARADNGIAKTCGLEKVGPRTS